MSPTLPPTTRPDTGLPALSEDLENVMEVLALCVLADRLTRDSELVEFANCAQMLARRLAPETIISRREAMGWFNANSARLAGIVDDWDAKRARLEAINDPDLRREMLAAIFAISTCDYQLADEESHFIQLALDAWSHDAVTPDMLAVLD